MQIPVLNNQSQRPPRILFRIHNGVCSFITQQQLQKKKKKKKIHTKCMRVFADDMVITGTLMWHID